MRDNCGDGNELRIDADHITFIDFVGLRSRGCGGRLGRVVGHSARSLLIWLLAAIIKVIEQTKAPGQSELRNLRWNAWLFSRN